MIVKTTMTRILHSEFEPFVSSKNVLEYDSTKDPIFAGIFMAGAIHGDVPVQLLRASKISLLPSRGFN